MVFVGAGMWVDGKLATEVPWFTIVGTGVGGSAAFYILYREVFSRGKDDDERK
jgi:hypothetical protein